MRSIFALRGDFNRAASGIIARMTYLLKVDINNVHIRTARAKYIDELIDLLFMQASAFQQEKWQGWSAQSQDLPRHQQLWLDPWRSLSDEVFKLEREKNDWQGAVADDFARWLNYRLKNPVSTWALSSKENGAASLCSLNGCVKWKLFCRRR